MCNGVKEGLGVGEKEEGSYVWEDEWVERPHYERVGALATKWGDEMGVDEFTQRIFREGVKEFPKAPV